MEYILEGDTLEEPATRIAEGTTCSAAHLFLAIECSRPLAGPSRHSLHNVDEVVIGRGLGRHVQRVMRGGLRQLILQVPDLRMSASHARLRRSDGDWEFQDCGSTNGSKLDGIPTERGCLSDGALLEFGHTFFTFRSALPIQPTTLGDMDFCQLHSEVAFATLIPELERRFEELARVARSRVPVLLQGETGCGKEVLARAVHARSGRSGPCIAINCGALPDSLLEAQLFGHVKGAFSGALRDEPGFVRAAHGGTLFLDEIGDLPRSSQAALLRVLQESEVVPIGATRPVPVDIRVIAATHAPVSRMVRQGAFRSDLYARLVGFQFEAPALRDRIEDLGLLAANLLAEIAIAHGNAEHSWEIQPEAARALLRHPWPRNIRELKHCLSTASVLGGGRAITVDHVQRTFVDSVAPSMSEPHDRRSHVSPSSQAVDLPVGDVALLRELELRFAECEGNVSHVARSMGKNRFQIQRWMKRFMIDPARYRTGS